ncbi:hypothetical protein SAMN04515647_2755 [Cohaesibacter sp. ES.047]|nr:hypothetical protein SAMN04515647_2755 [Cohaesibacter sp. ES.047]
MTRAVKIVKQALPTGRAIDLWLFQSLTPEFDKCPRRALLGIIEKVPWHLCHDTFYQDGSGRGSERDQLSSPQPVAMIKSPFQQ